MKLVLTLVMFSLSAFGADWYVAPSVSLGGGTLANPGSIIVAMAHTNWAASIAAGDTVYLRAGVYTNGTNTTYFGFSGSAGNLVTWRNYPGEFPKIDFPMKFQSYDYHRFRGIEFYDSHFVIRILGFADSNAGNNEWINCIIHDVLSGWNGASAGASVRGCIVWNVGTGPLAHVVYPYVRQFSGNICGWTSGSTIQLGTGGQEFNSNIIWNSGNTDILITDAQDGCVVRDNRLYNNYGAARSLQVQGFDGETVSVISNTVVAGDPVRLFGSFGTINFVGNSVFLNYSASQGLNLQRQSATGTWNVNSNSYYAISPRFVQFNDIENFRTFAGWKSANSGYDTESSSSNASNPPDSVTVFANADEPYRAHVAIYNWSGADTVNVSLTGVLSAGQNYQLFSAQNYLAGPIRTGTYNGTSISVPMTNLTAATVLYATNLVQPTATSPTFAPFVIQGFATANVGTLNVGTMVKQD